MSGPEVTLADVQRRAADNPNARYRAFDTYPWAKDPVFTVSWNCNPLSNGCITIAKY